MLVASLLASSTHPSAPDLSFPLQEKRIKERTTNRHRHLSKPDTSITPQSGCIIYQGVPLTYAVQPAKSQLHITSDLSFLRDSVLYCNPCCLLLLFLQTLSTSPRLDRTILFIFSSTCPFSQRLPPYFESE